MLYSAKLDFGSLILDIKCLLFEALTCIKELHVSLQ